MHIKIDYNIGKGKHTKASLVPITSVANVIIIFEKMNFRMMKEFDIQLYILHHGRDYIDIYYWIGIYENSNHNAWILF